MQLDCVTGAQPQNDSLKAPIVSLTKPNLRVIVHRDDAANLLTLAQQLTGQGKLRILARLQPNATPPLKHLATAHRD